ncbi:hypothetical protein [Burkholderia vietnamiensis]|uniref:hypothetical protein n=1 Tax=Burkholderia vietnamiensis TaxID=60552 RepID=UPI0018C88F9E|nr:hypothetical protein [Burkholderia vietnamiensis]
MQASTELSIGASAPFVEGVTSVWWRLKPNNGFPGSGATALYDYYFRQREWSHVLEYLEYQYAGARWINERAASKKASNKLHQLKVAESIGFNVPRTLITSDIAELIEFEKSIEPAKILFKTFTPYASPDGKLAYAQIVHLQDLRAMEGSVSSCPSLYQEYIEKAYELRITVVGDEIYCAKIIAADTEAASQDWRAGLFENKYELETIPDIAHRMVCQMSRELGIVYGAYDFIVRPDGSLVFLEVNPFGQWLWLEQQLGLPISRAIADWLRGD